MLERTFGASGLCVGGIELTAELVFFGVWTWEFQLDSYSEV